MGKTGTDKAAAVITLREASNNSQKQGFLTVMVKKAPHGLVVKRVRKESKRVQIGRAPLSRKLCQRQSQERQKLK